MSHNKKIGVLLVLVGVLLLLVLFGNSEITGNFLGVPLPIREETLFGDCTAEFGEDFAQNIVIQNYGCGREHYCWLAAWDKFLPGSVKTDFGCYDYLSAQKFIKSCRFALREACGPW